MIRLIRVSIFSSLSLNELVEPADKTGIKYQEINAVSDLMQSLGRQ